MELLTFILCAYGLTQILVYGEIFNRLRPKKGRLKGIVTCPMCMGFHVGWFWIGRSSPSSSKGIYSQGLGARSLLTLLLIYDL